MTGPCRWGSEILHFPQNDRCSHVLGSENNVFHPVRLSLNWTRLERSTDKMFLSLPDWLEKRPFDKPIRSGVSVYIVAVIPEWNRVKRGKKCAGVTHLDLSASLAETHSLIRRD